MVAVTKVRRWCWSWWSAGEYSASQSVRIKTTWESHSTFLSSSASACSPSQAPPVCRRRTPRARGGSCSPTTPQVSPPLITTSSPDHLLARPAGSDVSQLLHLQPGHTGAGRRGSLPGHRLPLERRPRRAGQHRVQPVLQG